MMLAGFAMAQQKSDTVKIKTSAICEMCQYTIEKDLAFEKGVKYAFQSIDNGILTVVYDPRKTEPQKIRKRVTMVGYHADSLKRDPKAYDALPECCKDGAHDGEKNHHSVSFALELV